MQKKDQQSVVNVAYSNSMTTKVFKEKTRGKFVLEDKIGQKH